MGSPEYLALLVIKTFGSWGFQVPSQAPITNTQDFLQFRDFIYTLLNRTAVSFNTVTLAMMYLQRLKKCHPQCRSAAVGSSARLMLAALIVAHKVLMDDCYDNKTWATVSGFTTAEVNKMEQELLFFCGHDMHVAEELFVGFQRKFVVALQQCTQKLASYANHHAPSAQYAILSGKAHPEEHHISQEQTYPSPSLSPVLKGRAKQEQMTAQRFQPLYTPFASFG